MGEEERGTEKGRGIVKIGGEEETRKIKSKHQKDIYVLKYERRPI